MSISDEFNPPQASFSVDAARDYPWGSGDNDNYFNICFKCNHPFRGHKRSLRCRKCQEMAFAQWNDMTIEEQRTHINHTTEAVASFFRERHNTHEHN